MPWRKTIEQFVEVPEVGKMLITQRVGTRSPKTIKRFMQRLKKIWRKYPHMSFAQLIYDADSINVPNDQLRDDQLMERLERLYK